MDKNQVTLKQYSHICQITKDLHITDFDQLLQKEYNIQNPCPQRAHNLVGMKYMQAVNYDTLNGDLIVINRGSY